jgi:hypothetical protein
MEKQTTPKTAVITLHAGASMLMLTATAKADGSAVTHVTTKTEGKTTRGMTEIHESMDKAKAHLATLAKKAESDKFGWQRRTNQMARRPDAFSELPKAPKTARA